MVNSSRQFEDQYQASRGRAIRLSPQDGHDLHIQSRPYTQTKWQVEAQASVDEIRNTFRNDFLPGWSKCVDQVEASVETLEAEPEESDALKVLKKRRTSLTKNPYVVAVAKEFVGEEDVRMSTAEIMRFQDIAAQVKDTSKPIPRLPDGDTAKEINTRTTGLKCKEKDKLLMLRQKSFLAVLFLIPELTEDIGKRLYTMGYEAIEREERLADRPCTELRKGFRKLIKGDGVKREYLIEALVKRMTRAGPFKALQDVQSLLRLDFLEREFKEEKEAHEIKIRSRLREHASTVREMDHDLSRKNGFGEKISGGLKKLMFICSQPSYTFSDDSYYK